MSDPQDPQQPAPKEQGPQRPAPQGSSPTPAVPQPPAPPYAAPQYGQASGTPQYAAPQYGQPYGTPPQVPQPSKKSRKRLWIVLGIVGGVLLLVAVGVGVLVNFVSSETSKARGLADDFNKLIIAGDTGTAYDEYLHPALMEKLSKDDFTAGVRGLELNASCKPNYTDLRVSSSNGTNGADVAGSLDCDGKRIQLAYRFEGSDDLKMVNIRLRPPA